MILVRDDDHYHRRIIRNVHCQLLCSRRVRRRSELKKCIKLSHTSHKQRVFKFYAFIHQSSLFLVGTPLPSPDEYIKRQDSKLPPIGSPRASKSTLSILLTKNFSVQHILVSNLLRHIKNSTTYPEAGIFTSLLNKQELINIKILVSILSNKLEKLEL